MIAELRLTLAQLNPTVGDIHGNTKKILDTWQKYDEKSDLVIFPELFLCGYMPEDLVLNTNFLKACENAVELICTQSKNNASAAIIPTLYQENACLYNAALLIDKGDIQHIFKKHELPNYGIFDEKRLFSAGALPDILELKGHKLGIMICEDMWLPTTSSHLKNQGAECLIVINGSPYCEGKPSIRDSVAKHRCLETGLSLIYLNMVGGQDDLVFDGTSFIMKNTGEIVYKAPSFKDLAINVQCTIPEQGSGYAFEITEGLNTNGAKAQREEALYNALTLGLKDYIHKNGFSNVLIGLSGGIDSALVAAIAVDALGADHVHCVMMPSEFTSKDSLTDAMACAKALDVRYDVISIKAAMQAFESTISNLNGLAHENTQSRIRGTILMGISNMTGAMVLTTGNKSEMATGYCTIYGDMNGGFNPLKDIYKTDVYKIAAWRNSKNNVMPERILTKAPTAELREGQTDQDSLPPYALLDDILRLLVEYDDVDWSAASKEVLDLKGRCEQHPQTIEKIAKLLKNTEYKRFQSAPGTRLTAKAFGRERRYPITNHFVNGIAKNT